jgi:GNAT superfamily N-acetyltransferase
MNVIIRPRSEADIDACTLALRRVHERDRYPEVWPADPAGRLSPPNPELLAAVVAERDQTVVGHVGLGAGGVLPEIVRRSTGTEFVVSVIRLYVPPAARRAGVGSQLLTAAARMAADRGSAPCSRSRPTARRRWLCTNDAVGGRCTPGPAAGVPRMDGRLGCTIT